MNEIFHRFLELTPLIGLGTKIKDEVRIGTNNNMAIVNLTKLRREMRESMGEKSSLKWMITIRTLMILSGILNLIGMGWFRFITTKTIETEKTVAVLCSQMNTMSMQMNRIENRLMRANKDD